MKVLYDHQIFTQQQYGGVSRYHYQLIKELNKLNSVRTQLSLRYSNNFYIIKDNNFEINRFFPNQNFYFKRTILDHINRISTNRILKNGDWDIFHPTYYNPYFLNHLNNKPFIITVYDTIHEKYPEIRNSIDKTLEHKKEVLKKAGLIVAISNSTKNDIMKIYNIPAEKIVVVPLAASIFKHLTLPKEKLGLPEKYILYVGNRDFYKNFLFFIKAAAQLIKQDKELFLIAAGGGRFTNNETKFFNSMQIDHKVIYSEADDVSLATLYSNALAFIFPTLYEGFGIPSLEAMNCDCPVIMSNTSSLPEVGGNAAIYFDPLSIEDIRNKITSVIYNTDLRLELIEKGIEQRNKFSFEKTAKQTFEVYKQFLSSQ